MTFLKSRLFLVAKVLSFVLLTAVSVSAQPDDPPVPDDVPVPITGLEYLIISGGILGGYKLYKNKKNSQNP